MMVGATDADWSYLANFESMAGAVKIYNHSEHAVHPITDDTPWPIVWVLGRCSNRHTCVNKKEPDSFFFIAKSTTSSISKSGNIISMTKWTMWCSLFEYPEVLLHLALFPDILCSKAGLWDFKSV
jgi:hypothetical protein